MGRERSKYPNETNKQSWVLLGVAVVWILNATATVAFPLKSDGTINFLAPMSWVVPNRTSDLTNRNQGDWKGVTTRQIVDYLKQWFEAREVTDYNLTRLKEEVLFDYQSAAENDSLFNETLYKKYVEDALKKKGLKLPIRPVDTWEYRVEHSEEVIDLQELTENGWPYPEESPVILTEWSNAGSILVMHGARKTEYPMGVTESHHIIKIIVGGDITSSNTPFGFSSDLAKALRQSLSASPRSLSKELWRLGIGHFTTSEELDKLGIDLSSILGMVLEATVRWSLTNFYASRSIGSAL